MKLIFVILSIFLTFVCSDFIFPDQVNTLRQQRISRVTTERILKMPDEIDPEASLMVEENVDEQIIAGRKYFQMF